MTEMTSLQQQAGSAASTAPAKALEFLAFTLGPEQVKPAPEMGSVLDTDYLIGLGTLDDRMLILVDIDKLMSSSEMGLIAQATH